MITKIHVQNHKGHETLVMQSQAEVDRTFRDMISRGGLAYIETKADGNPFTLDSAEQVRSVQEAEAKGATELFVTAPLVGG